MPIAIAVVDLVPMLPVVFSRNIQRAEHLMLHAHLSIDSIYPADSQNRLDEEKGRTTI